ncbi:MAG: chorismate-binding protein, partial [Bacteroidales bacterium]|nr:chorismate-binding protein [Bacteroidales bacterium]
MSKEPERLSRKGTIEAINAFASSGDPFMFLISFNGGNNLVFPTEKAAQNGFYMEFPGMTNHDFGPAQNSPINFRTYPVDPIQYQKAFDHVTGQIHYGNSFLLNLTFPTPVETNYSLRDIFTASRATYKLYIENELVVFSPERFIRIRGNTISSNPMKGTINAAIPGAHALLSSDRKEDAEHNTIVDLIRNDLSTVASNVRVMRFKYIE